MDNQLPSNDHDLLVKLDTKMDNLSINFREFQTNIITRVARAETRLDQMDIYHAAIPLKDYDATFHWVEKMRSNINFLIALGAFFSATIGAFISYILSRVFKM